MSVSSRRWPAYLAVGIIGAYGIFIIHKANDPKFAPKAAHIVHFVAHFPKSKPACTLRAVLMLGGHTDAYFDAGDEVNQKLWALAKECGGTITIEQPHDGGYLPHGPARKG